MPLTTNGLPYPAASDTPDVPRDVQALAEAMNKFAKTAVWGTYQRTANQAIPTAVATNVIGTQITMEGGLTLNASTGAVTVPANAAGVYLLNGWASWTGSSTTGARFTFWYRNGARLLRTSGIAAAGLTLFASKVVRLAAGDVLTFVAYQASGASIDLDGTNNATGYDITRLAP